MISTSLGQEEPERLPISGDGHVSIDGVEEPERGVGGVVEAFVPVLGEEVRNQPVPDGVGERPQDRAGLDRAAGDERQALEADHRVATPVREPVVARDHRARAPGIEARRGVVGARRGRDEELVGGEDEVRREPIARLRMRRSQQAAGGVSLPSLARGSGPRGRARPMTPTSRRRSPSIRARGRCERSPGYGARPPTRSRARVRGGSGRRRGASGPS